MGYVLASIDTSGGDGFVLDSIETQEVAAIQIVADYERASIDAALSEVTVDTDGVTLVKLYARMQVTTSMGSTPRWLEPTCKLTGVLGLRPRIEIVPYVNGGGGNANHQGWASDQRAHFSYDGETWQPFDTLSRVDRLRWRHNTAFTQDTVWVARSWPWSVTQCGQWIESLAALHPTKVQQTLSAVSFSPVTTTSFPAQAFIVGEVEAATDERGFPIPATPMYGFEIHDQAYAPTQCAIITGGIHAGEDVGELVLRELIDWLLGGSIEAVTLRQKFVVIVYPLLNTSGRYGGYYRGSPSSNIDTNREWNLSTPTHHCVNVARPAIINDVGGRRVWWAIDAHASPSGTAVMQTGTRTAQPATVDWYSAAQARFPSGSWGIYGSIDETLPSTSGNLRAWFYWQFDAVVPMLLETCERLGPLSPTIMRPYAEAAGGALYDLDQAGYFDAAISADASGAFASLTLTAPVAAASGIHVIPATAAGAFASLALTAPAATATGSTVIAGTATGDMAPLALTPPTATATGSAVGEGIATGALPALALTAPTASATANASASGEMPIVVTTAPTGTAAGTTAGSVVASGAFAALGLTAPAASASSTSQTDGVASGLFAQITITAPRATVPLPFVIPAARRRWTNLNGQPGRPRYLN